MFDFFSLRLQGLCETGPEDIGRELDRPIYKTLPSLYPHQWHWDSGFIAIGYAHYNEDRAMQEIRSLFGHQWENGMVPQIAFDPETLGNYFPEPDFWQVPAAD